MGAPQTLHQVVTGNLYNEHKNYLKGKTCRAFIAPFEIRFPVKNRKKDEEITTVVQPDVCIVCDPSKVDAKGVCGAPDLVIEVLSPGNTRKEMRDKFELYEEAGVKEYWVIYPTEQNVAVFLLDTQGKFGAATFYVNGDKLASTILPGLELNVDDIFIDN
jgi:Uma2 family endonuclease